jgi:hypothetical protein
VRTQRLAPEGLPRETARPAWRFDVRWVECVAVAGARIRVQAAEEVRLTAREAYGERARSRTLYHFERLK